MIAAAAIVLARRSASAADPSAFFRRSLLALAVLELDALLGLVVSIVERRPEPALALPGLSFAVALLFVFPAGLSYFRRRETPEGAPRTRS